MEKDERIAGGQVVRCAYDDKPSTFFLFLLLLLLFLLLFFFFLFAADRKEGSIPRTAWDRNTYALFGMSKFRRNIREDSWVNIRSDYCCVSFA